MSFQTISSINYGHIQLVQCTCTGWRTDGTCKRQDCHIQLALVQVGVLMAPQPIS